MFKIESPTHFTELKKFANKWERYDFEAQIFPDRQLISDMIDMRDNHWMECGTMEFEDIVSGHLES